jgi:DNA-binding GntR family transcriptional regulator
MTQDNRAQRSIVDHREIIAALAAHDADRAERLVRDHTMGLAAHVEKFGDFLDAENTSPAARERSRRASDAGEGDRVGT